MIVRFTGTLTDLAEDAAIIEREGLAREVLIPGYSFTELLADRGKTVTLHTFEYLEGSQATGNLIPRLIGFPRPDDRAFFRRFVSVKGIGMRKALKALAEPIGQIAGWIERGDAKSLAKLPGIGKRAAEMIIAELKGKLEDVVLIEQAAAAGRSAELDSEALSAGQRDALELLTQWGDNRLEATRWLTRAGELNPSLELLEDWVRAAYRIKSGVDK